MSKLVLSLFASLFFISTRVDAARPINGTTNFNGVPAATQVTGSGNGAGITAVNIQGFDFNLTTVSSPATMAIDVWDGAVGTGNGVGFSDANSSINPKFNAIIIRSNDGARFDLLSLGINAQNGTDGGDAVVTVTGLNASGTPVAGANITATASVTALTNFAFNASFKGIFSVRITSSDLIYAFIDNINLANVGSTLPLTWLDFTASVESSSVRLGWHTAMEVNTKNFLVQHSADGANWTNAGEVAAAGNSQSVRGYSFIDATPSHGINYYRLLQRDIDGQQSFSTVIPVLFDHAIAAFKVYPNPVTGEWLRIQAGNATEIRISNSAGIVVLVKKLAATSQALNIGHLPKGIYYLSANGETRTFVKL